MQAHLTYLFRQAGEAHGANYGKAYSFAFIID